MVVGREAPFLRPAVAEYAGRVRHYAHLDIVGVAPAPWPADPAPAEARRLLADEAGRVRPHWRGDVRVLLAREGRALASEAVAARLGELEGKGVGSVALLVGGPGGVAAELAREADGLWSLGPATLPHTLAAVVVLEQLYRAYRLLRGEPYHR